MRKIYFLLLTVLFAATTNAQLTGTKNIPGDYASLALAVTDLNTQGVGAGGVIFNIASGYTETAPAGGINVTATGTAANPVVFQKSGAGVNPLITSPVGTITLTTASAAVDGIVSFSGSDYVTIDGIDLLDNNVSGAAMMEYGYGFFKPSATDGCHNNTIKNCVITMNNANNVDGTTGIFGPGSKGIYFGNVAINAMTTDLVIATAGGRSDGNTIISNTIQNCFMGIYMRGYGDGVAPYTYIDQNNSIGGNAPGLGNIVRNYASPSSILTSFGIQTFNQNNLLVQYNNVNNLAGGGSPAGGLIGGISATGSFTLNNSTYNIKNNTISLGQGTNTFQTSGINVGTAGGTGTVTISDNILTGFTNTSGATAGAVFATVVSNVAGATVNITNNTYSNNQISAIVNMISLQASATAATANITGNTFTNNTISNNVAGTTILIANGAAITGALNITNNVINGVNFVSAMSNTAALIFNGAGAATLAYTATGNNIQNVTYPAGFTSTLYLMYCATGTPASAVFNSNTLTNITMNSVTSASIYGIYNTSAMGTYTVTNNTISNLSTSTTGTTAMIYNTASISTAANVSNNSISNITRSGASGTHYNVYTGSPANGTYNLNTIDGVSFSAVGSSGTIYGIYDISSGVNMTYTNNIVRNLSTPTAGTLYGIREFGVTGTKVIQNNQVYNFSTSAGGAGGLSATGISWLAGGTTDDISNNKVYSINSTGTTGGAAGTIIGILCSSGTTNNIYKNKVYDLSTNSTGGSVWGMQITAGTTNNVYNNLIGDLRAPFVNSATDLVRGINITAATASANENISFNTIYLNGTSAGANFSNTGLYHTYNTTATTATLNLRNNIIVNNSTPNGTGLAVALRRSASTNLNNFNTVSNRNLLYAGTPSASTLIYYDGTNSAQTLAAYQALVTPRDANAVTENPPFLSTTGSSPLFLHINPAGGSLAQGQASPIAGIIDDYDGDVRNGTTPDIGADEFTLCTGAVGGIAAVSGPSTFCGSGTPVITCSGYSAGVGSGYQWMSSTNIADYPLSGTPVAGQTNPASLSTGVVSTTTYYWLKVTCPSGTATDYSNMLTISINPSAASVTPSAPSICNGGSITLTENGGTGTSWSWSPGGATTQAITVSPATTTTYTVTVNSPGGCVAMANVTVTVNNPPTGVTASASSNLICPGSSVDLFSTADTPSSNILSQDFESGLGSWTVTNGSSGGTTPALANFNIRPHGWTSGTTFNSPGGLNFILTDADAAGSGVSALTTLVSPSFSTVGYTALNLSLRHYYRALTGPEAFVEISTNGGGSWSLLKNYSATQGAANAFVADNIDFTSYVGNPNVSIRFRYQAGWAWYWAIDDIAVTGTPVANTFSWTSIPAGFTSSLQNPTGVTPPVTTTYTVTVTGVGGCTSSANTTVTLYPVPNAVAAPSSQSTCTGNPITTIALSGAVGGTTFNWTRDNTVAVTGIPASGSGDISGTLTNTTAAPVTVTFTITPTANGCPPGPSTTATVTVNPLPVLSGAITQPTTCVSADGAIDLTVSGAPGPYTYFWTTNGGSGIVQGVEDQSGLTVGQYTVLVTDGNGCQQTAVFNLTGPGGCSICPVIGSVVTNPTPGACAGSTVTLTASGLTFMGVTYGITFKYSLVALADPYVGGTVIGTVPNGSLGGGGTTATLVTSFPVSGNYIIYAILDPLPIDPFCRPSAQVNLVVNPNPVVNPVTNQTFCNGTLVPTGTFNFSSPTTVFGGKILIGYSDTGGPPTQLRNDLLALAGVTQVDLFDASSGTPSLALMQQYDIVVPFSNNPYADPVALGDNLADYVDANGIVVGLGFTFYTSPYGPTGRWLTGNYSPYTASTNLDFAVHTLGTYTVGHPLMAGVTTLTSDFHNVVPVAAGATEVAQWDNAESLIAFKGRVVGITAYIGQSATWSGDFAKVIVNAGNWLGGGAITFNWTNNNTTIGLGASGTGSSLPAFTATNAGSAPVTATVSVTASYTNAGITCTGPATTFNITVNPEPQVNAVANQTVCNTAPTAPVTFSGPVAGTVFNWVNNTPSIGLAASGTGNIASFNAINLTNVPVTATITVTPVTTPTGTVTFNYTGAFQTFVVPAGVTSVSIQASGAQGMANAAGVALGGLGGSASGNLTVTPGETLWVYVGGGGATSATGGFNGGGNGGTTGTCLTALGGGGGGASDVRQTANTLAGRKIVAGGGGGTAGNRVVGCARGAGGGGGGGYYGGGGGCGYPGTTGVVPTGGSQAAGGAGGITGTAFGATNGLPGALGTGGAGGNEIFSNQAASQAVIFSSGAGGGLTGGAGQQSGLNNFTGQSGAGGSSYIGGVTGGSTTAGVRSGNGVVTISYATSGPTCTGPSTSFTITVNPTPNAVATPPTQTICSGSAMTPIVLSGNVAGTVFNWTRNNTVNVTGIANAGSGNISGIPINNTTVQQTVIYTITPVANGCTGASITATLIVNIAPTITCPANITVNNAPGLCGANVTYPPATATGSPAPVITYSQASGSFFPVGTTTVTATATNICGVATCTFTITVIDVQAPTITCPANIVANTDVGACVATVATPNPVTADNCAVTTLTWVMTGATTGSSPAAGINFVGTQVFNLNGTTGQGVTTITYTVKDAAGNTTTCSFTVTVNDAWIPVIGGQPTNQTACAGASAVFSVTASVPAGNPLTYQWQAWNGTAWVNIAGATSATLPLNAVTLSMNTNSYRCILTGRCSVVTSGFATLYVNALPTISLLASGTLALLPGHAVTLTAVVSPGGGSYQWFKNGVAIPGATGSSLVGLTVDDIGSYTCRYTDLNGCVQTSAAMVVTGQVSDGLFIYPNPNTGHFHIRLYNQPNEEITVRIFDMKGAQLYMQKVITILPYTDIQVELMSDRITAGETYVVEVRGTGGRLIGSKKIIVYK